MTLTKTRTYLYGGAFNPPTLAHEAIVEALASRAEAEQASVWIMPSGERKDKTIGVPALDRLALIQAMIKSVRTTVDIRVIQEELVSSTPTETIDTYVSLTAKYPQRSFVWVFGTDSILSMPNWRCGEWMLKNLQILAVARGENTLVSPLYSGIEILYPETIDTSSTEVRLRIANGLAYEELVSTEVCALTEQLKHKKYWQ